MQAFDIQFIEKADGPKLVEGLEYMAVIFDFELSELKKKAGFADSTFNRWASAMRKPRRSSRQKIKSFVNQFYDQDQ